VSSLFAEARAAKAMGDRKQADKLVRVAWALKGAFANISHAYAMTVHKAQGSTFDTVLIDWDDLQVAARRDPVQAARLMYVAVTRAASNVCILVN
jgi:exodeoxyribonuclease-5